MILTQRRAARKRWAFALAACCVTAQGSVWGQGARSVDGPTYFEFGTVTAMGQRSVEVQGFDPMQQSMVRHSFVLDRETRADLVHVGDAVEVIYAQEGMELRLHRLVALEAGIPKAGPPNNGIALGDAEVVVPLRRPGVAPAGTGRTATEAGVAAAPAAPGANAAPTTSRGSSKGKSPATKSAPVRASVTASGTAKVQPNTGAGYGASAVSLGSAAGPRPTVVVPVNVGEVLAVRQPVAKPVLRDQPAEECNRSSAEWPSQPLSIAVLDFRYPTEREESHDVARTGGGSGTQVADLVFGRLEQPGDFAVDRGDRRRLDRTDIAGAARLGRQLGVDAVLAGTLMPVEEPPDPDGYAVKTKFYELRAGLVDTCTGQVLMKLTSNSCNVMDGSATSTVGGCAGAQVTAKQAENPASHAAAFEVPVETLLGPLLHNVTGGKSADAVARVTSVAEHTVTMQLAAGAQMRVGDQVAVHASRLAKNPTTYTLNALHDEEIGRVILRSVQGGVAAGVFSGDIQPRAGDAVVVVAQ